MSGHRLERSVDELLAQSRAVVGIEVADDDIVEPLTVLHHALDKERAQLDAEGARAFEERILRLLVNRLRMQRDLDRHPEIAQQPILGPVIVMGTARSGTTKLQKALAASGDFNVLTFWKSLNWASVSGTPNEAVESRIAEADAFCHWFDQRSPEAKLGHPFAALEPEEDGPLAEGCFVTSNFVGYAEVPGYAAWLGQQSTTAEFAFLRSAMQYLQWQELADASRPWLLKSPAYTSRELDVLEVFPDARFVMAHRSPLETLPSTCKLVGHFRKAYGTSTPDPLPLMAHAAASIDAQLAIRRAHPDLPLLDLLFDDITDNLPAIVGRVYTHAGIPLRETAREEMVRWDEDNAMHKLGRFTYSLGEIGLDEATVRERMASSFELLGMVEARRWQAAEERTT
ncbi:MAG TPA: sulfotransferase [Microthrixaceae bacterium]|nr:sulfotransferase [Microthrixaceae bacterium]